MTQLLRILFPRDVQLPEKAAVAFLVGPRAYDVFPLNQQQLDYWMSHALPLGKVLIRLDD